MSQTKADYVELIYDKFDYANELRSLVEYAVDNNDGTVALAAVASLVERTEELRVLVKLWSEAPDPIVANPG